MMGLVGFLSPDDPRLASTVSAIQKHLTKDGLLMRYDTSKQVDGLPGGEGVFIACTFWLADNFVLLNRAEEAREIFDHVSALRNDVGLFSEEYCPVKKRMLGNFPQAFSHIAHVNTAANLSKQIGPAGDRSHAGTR
jgi:GH15 family glucan-1,4-alpha-glucosidase